MRSTILGALAALLVPLASATAQRGGVSVGYVRATGRIGDAQSDHGLALRVGIDLTSGSRIRLGLEGGLDFLNQPRRRFTSPCLLPGGAVGPCHFDLRARDVGRSLSALVRLEGRGERVRPYGLVGVGVLSVRTSHREEVRDDTGAILPNFSADGSSTDGALPLHLGLGLMYRPPGRGFALTLEGRATGLIYNYSGGLQSGVSPAILVGIRTRG